MSSTALVDTGFWIALFDEREEHHQNAGKRSDYLAAATLVVPWPILYETLRTRFMRRPDWVRRLDGRLKKPNVAFVDDRDYCDEAYTLAVEFSTLKRRPISMVDMLCRLLIADTNVRIDCVLTTNPADFADICRSRNIALL